MCYTFPVLLADFKAKLWSTSASKLCQTLLLFAMELLSRIDLALKTQRQTITMGYWQLESVKQTHFVLLTAQSELQL
jgi:hypothetical protein